MVLAAKNVYLDQTIYESLRHCNIELTINFRNWGGQEKSPLIHKEKMLHFYTIRDRKIL